MHQIKSKHVYRRVNNVFVRVGVISKFGLGALPVPPLAMMTRATLTAQSYYYYYYYYYFVRVLLEE